MTYLRGTWKWLLGRPKPVQPRRRIIMLAELAALAACFLVAREGGTARSVAEWLLIFATVVCVTGIVVLGVDAWRRGKAARRG